jgi:aminoglycoside phosphotransferase family enzyme/predicted kinase
VSNAESLLQDVIRLLKQGETYPDRPTQVTVHETHISYVFLAGDHAFKLKKPVRFEFVDFSTLEARRRACEEEVRLNRRLAGDVYLGVVPVTRAANGELRLEGEGPVVEWLVKMRRLPEERMLDQLIASGKVRETEIDRLAGILARFYKNAPPVALEPPQYRAEIERHVRANRAELLMERHQLSQPLVRRVHTTQLLFLTACPTMLDARVGARRIIDGHGDLRPEHVCLKESPVIFDCLEFSAELRRLDVADELSFFAMECEHLGAESIGDRVLSIYRRETGDDPPARLLWFYKCYRACVRAKVAALRCNQLHERPGPRQDDELRCAQAYLNLAGRYAGELAAPFLLIVRGLSGSGKTTLAMKLAKDICVERLGTDDVRRELFGSSAGAAPYNAGRYAPEARQRVYDEIFARAQTALSNGGSLVLDGTFPSAAHVERFQRLTSRHRANLLAITCRCSTEAAQRRIAARLAEGAGSSEARPELLQLQQQVFEQLPPGLPSIDVDNSAELPLDAAHRALERLLR